MVIVFRLLMFFSASPPTGLPGNLGRAWSIPNRSCRQGIRAWLAFQYRMMLDFPLPSVAQSIAICDWIAKNRMNWVHPCPNAHGEPKTWYERRGQVVPELKKRGLKLLVGGHTMHTWMPETNFQAHPEWFADCAVSAMTSPGWPKQSTPRSLSFCCGQPDLCGILPAMSRAGHPSCQAHQHPWTLSASSN